MGAEGYNDFRRLFFSFLLRKQENIKLRPRLLPPGGGPNRHVTTLENVSLSVKQIK